MEQPALTDRLNLLKDVVSRDPLFSVSEVAQILGISEPTIYRMIQSGQLGHLYLNKLLRIRKSDVEAFLKNGLKE